MAVRMGEERIGTMDVKHAVVRNQGEHTWIAEVLPSEPEAQEWAGIFRERGQEGVTYTVVPLASVMTE